MSSRSIGVTNVWLRRWMMSWVIRSPSCSQTRMSRASSLRSGNVPSIWSSRSAARTMLPAASSNRSKNSRSLGTKTWERRATTGRSVFLPSDEPLRRRLVLAPSPRSAAGRGGRARPGWRAALPGRRRGGDVARPLGRRGGGVGVRPGGVRIRRWPTPGSRRSASCCGRGGPCAGMRRAAPTVARRWIPASTSLPPTTGPERSTVASPLSATTTPTAVSPPWPTPWAPIRCTSRTSTA